MKRLTLRKLLLSSVLLCAAPLSAAELPWQGAATIRPDIKTGYGWVIDDLEQHVVTTDHPMVNTSDPGNWAHELSHQVNSDLRQQTRGHDNCFYVGGGIYLRLNEPQLTLRQVGAMVPAEYRGFNYKVYFQQMRRYWDDSPLFVLDEATAYANCLKYHVTTKTQDEWRLKTTQQFVVYSRVLVLAVKKHDPNYKQMGELEAYVEFNTKRVAWLVSEYNKGESR